uniref:Carbamoyltransferase n=1 Tax=Phaselicystis flava TaxID=525924 RepID=A0A3S5GYG2_9BACT|nr:carbamoyltransferase [Phaselicystis flava]
MSGNVLGISAYYHDSAAALVREGEILAAAQEERFSRKKHDPRFPTRAVTYCLEAAELMPSDLEAVAFYDNLLLSFDRVMKNAVSVAPSGREQFVEACLASWGVKARIMDDLEAVLGERPRLLMTDHHMAHAASAFYPSPFEEAAILTVDGVGEWATCSLGHGKGSKIELLQEIRYPHSLGLLYSAFTYYCGFKVNSGEYKLMGLAPYGQPRYADLIRDNLIHVLDDGSFRLDTSYFGFLDAGVMTNARFDALFGAPARRPETPITRFQMDLAASIQLVTEEVVSKLTAHILKLTGSKNLVMAGGVALNCVANGRLRREAGLDRLFIQPAAGDAGGALGAALLVSHGLLGAPRRIEAKDGLKGSYLGPSFSPRDVEIFLARENAPGHRVEDAKARAEVVAAALAEGKIVGLVSGRMEFGPRALGARSILGDPRRADTQRTMNLEIKHRESFRPFAPAVLADKAAEYFDLAGESPYMLLVAPVREERRRPMERAVTDGDDMLPIVNQARSDVPAITHVDYSARVQTVDGERNPNFFEIVRAFYEKTGCPVVVNTSFNVRGEPIVCTPQDAYRCFMRTGMDLLVIEDWLLWKHEQPALEGDGEWRNEYELD